MIRLVNVTSHYRPPISLWGRIETFRWIIPGYDRVFVGPFAVTVVLSILLTSHAS